MAEKCPGCGVAEGELHKQGCSKMQEKYPPIEEPEYRLR